MKENIFLIIGCTVSRVYGNSKGISRDLLPNDNR